MLMRHTRMGLHCAQVKAFAAKHKLVGPVGINFFETEAHKK